VGLPGDRTFFLQVRDRGVTMSVSLEKQQSAALAEGIDDLLTTLRDRDGNPHHVPDETPVELIDDDPLDLPLDDEFRVGVLTLGWDPTTAQVVIEAAPVVELDAGDIDGSLDPADLDEDALAAAVEEAEPEEVVIVRIPVGAARAFVDRTRAIVAAGRGSRQ
jgi:uncharacterized repeat protein (TIGR03847 family)